MSLLNDVKSQMNLVKNQEREEQIDGYLDNRSFVLGPALVDKADTEWGLDSEEYAPRSYGAYVSTSNAIYSILNERSNLLAALPLTAFRFTGGTRSRVRGFTREKQKQYRRDVLQKLARVAHQPTRFQRTLTKEGLEEITTGEIYDLLGYVNPFWTPQKLIKMTDMGLGLWGRSFWFLERGENSTMPPQEIWYAKSPDVKVVPHETEYIDKFIFDPYWAEAQDFSIGETIWFNFPHPLNEFQPLSPIASARIYADHAGAAMFSNMNLHKQGLQLGGVVWPTNNKQWSNEVAKEIEEDLHRRFSGVSKAHRWGAFRHEIGMKESGVTPRDAEFLEGMNWDLESVARSFNWPLDLIGGRRTYENVAAAMVAAYTFAVLPQASFIASELIEQLIPKYRLPDVDMLVFDASEVSVLQEAEAKQWERESSMIDKGVKTINEYRRQIGDEDVDWGNVWWVSSTMVPAGTQMLKPDQSLEEEFDELFNDTEGANLEDTLKEMDRALAGVISKQRNGNGNGKR